MRHHGRTRVDVEASVDRVPIFAKAGAVIPTQQVLQYSDQAPIDPLTVTVFLADSASYEYYEDDGHSFDYEKGVFAKRSIRLAKREGELQLTFGEVKGSYRFPDRSLVIQIVGVENQPNAVSLCCLTLAWNPLNLDKYRSRGWLQEARNVADKSCHQDTKTQSTTKTERIQIISFVAWCLCGK
ncbi:MAG: Alpha-glucosidase [Bacteroidetes bacterium]|nr:Alpha-glucosidase [Bacteroidota bacterium]